MKILLVGDMPASAGGIPVSGKALQTHLLKLGHEVEWDTGKPGEFVKSDLIWTHGWSDPRTTHALEQAKVPIWVQLHDYKDFCLTGRRSTSPNFDPCLKPLDGGCFWTHATKGCGKGRNFLTLGQRYADAQKRLTVIRRAHRILVFSEFVKQVAIANGVPADKILVTPPWCHPLNPNPIPISRTSTKKILWVGRLVKEKGPELFINLIENLLERKGFPIEASIVGDGPERANLEKAVAERGLSMAIHFEGWLDGQQMVAEYQKARFLAVTSRWPEPFGLVGVEAMSLGVPVIAYTVGGISEWCKQESGCFEIKPGDHLSFISAALRLLDDDALIAQYSHQAQEAAKTNFSEEIQKQALSRLLENICCTAP